MRVNIEPSKCSDTLLVWTYNYHSKQTGDLSLPTKDLIYHARETWSFLKEIAKRRIKL
jgi:hypothetical protein|tara:strand:+ start:534 stop:707 length:174 start_codon:yes stop_codon:yes gene_type:complete